MKDAKISRYPFLIPRICKGVTSDNALFLEWDSLTGNTSWILDHYRVFVSGSRSVDLPATQTRYTFKAPLPNIRYDVSIQVVWRNTITGAIVPGGRYSSFESWLEYEPFTPSVQPTATPTPEPTATSTPEPTATSKPVSTPVATATPIPVPDTVEEIIEAFTANTETGVVQFTTEGTQTKVDEKAFELLAEQKGTILRLHGEGFTWNFASEDMVDPSLANGSFDAAIRQEISDAVTKAIEAVTQGNPYTAFDTAFSGKLPGKATLEYQLDAKVYGGKTVEGYPMDGKHNFRCSLIL